MNKAFSWSVGGAKAVLTVLSRRAHCAWTRRETGKLDFGTMVQSNYCQT